MPHCGNCEEFVTGAYLRVFAPPGMTTVRVRPSREDMVREGSRRPRGQSAETVTRAAVCSRTVSSNGDSEPLLAQDQNQEANSLPEEELGQLADALFEGSNPLCNCSGSDSSLRAG